MPSPLLPSSTWLRQLLHLPNIFYTWNIPSSIFFPNLLWHLWTRNKNALDKQKPAPSLDVVFRLSSEFYHVPSTPKASRKNSWHRMFPTNNTTSTSTIFLHTDAATPNHATHTGIGGVFGDINGRWIMGFAGIIAETNTTMQKFMALLRGLAVNHKLHNLQITLDVANILTILNTSSTIR
ncbi:hypothetical protein RND71_016051 [Anisodus tanguticus]|uniref:RNase H type-1 domain-containing protein n=1 Tax=Anisodus tanguticus TaxID=243964 RepID=A0AAE1S6P3_9SOLA|nr:hypothetical protein RND71_016051 [Anisodus tanguticus]